MKLRELFVWVLLLLLAAANFAIPDVVSTRADIEYSNKALQGIKDGESAEAPLDPDSREVQEIFSRANEVARESFRTSFDKVALVVAPAAALLTWLFLARYAVISALLFLVYYFSMLSAGLSGVMGISAFFASFLVAMLALRWRKARE